MKKELQDLFPSPDDGEEWDQIEIYREEVQNGPVPEPSAEGLPPEPEKLSMERACAIARMYRKEKNYEMEALQYEYLLLYGDVRESWRLTMQYSCGAAWMAAGREENALYWLEKAARLGHKGAGLRCGLLLAKSRDAMERAKALYWLEQAAKDGDDKIQDVCGDMNYYGRSTAVDYARALYWYEKAAAQGNVRSQYACGMMHYRGEGTKADPARALAWLEKAADRSHVKSQLQCAWMYFRGEGTGKDYPKALHRFEEAAKGGQPEAWLMCGRMYFKGVGTGKDPARSFFWYEKLLGCPDDPGNAEAKFICGSLYCAGEGVEEDREKGRRLIKEAAEQGHKPAKAARVLKFLY